MEKEMGSSRSCPSSAVFPGRPESAEPSAAGITITRAEARRLVNYAHKASCGNWSPFIRENGLGGDESPWAEFLRVADRLWAVLFPEHDVRQDDPRLLLPLSHSQPPTGSVGEGEDSSSSAPTEAAPSGATEGQHSAGEFVCPRCGKDCRPNGDPHLGTCEGPPRAEPPPWGMQG